MKYLVKKFFHEDYVTYREGEEIELTEKRARQLREYVEKIEGEKTEETKPEETSKGKKRRRI